MCDESLMSMVNSQGHVWTVNYPINTVPWQALKLQLPEKRSFVFSWPNFHERNGYFDLQSTILLINAVHPFKHLKSD